MSDEAIPENSEPQTPKSSRKGLKKFGIVTGALIFLFFLLIVIIYYVLRAGSLTQTAVNYINPAIEPLGVKITQLSLAKIDLFGSIEILGLKLDWQDEQLGAAHVEADRFFLKYSFNDLISSKVNVEELVLQDILINAELLVQESMDDPPVEETPPLDLKTIEDLLSQPPLPVTLSSMEITNFGFDVTLRDKQSKQTIQGNIENLGSVFTWDTNALAFQSHIFLNQTIDEFWRITLEDINKKTIIGFTPRWKTKINAKLQNESNIWQLPKLDVIQETKIESVFIDEVQDSGENRLLEAASLVFNVNTTKTEDEKSVAPSQGLLGLLPIPVTTQVETQLEQVGVNFKDGDRVALTAQMNQNLAVELKSVLKSLTPPAADVFYNVKNRLSIPELALNADNSQVSTNDMLLDISLNGFVEQSEQQNTNLLTFANLSVSSNPVTFAQSANKDNPVSIEAQLTPFINLVAKLNMPNIEDLSTSNIELKPELVLQNINAKLSSPQGSEVYHIERKELDSTIKLVNNRINSKTNLKINSLEAPQLDKTISLEKDIRFNSDIEAKNVDLKLDLELEKTKLLIAKINAENQENVLHVNHDIKLNLPLWLENLHEAASDLNMLGHTRISLFGDSILIHSAENIQTANTDIVDQWPVTTSGTLNLIQISPPTVKEGVTIKNGLKVSYELDKAKDIRTSIDVATGGIQVEPLLTPIPIKLSNQNNVSWPLSDIKSKGKLSIANENALEFDLTVKDKPGKLSLKGDVFLSESPLWKKYIAELEAAEAVGQLFVNLSPDIKVKHPAKTILELDTNTLEGIELDAKLQAEVSQSTSLIGSQLVLEKPFTLKQKLEWSTAALNSQTEFYIGALELPQQLALQDLPGNISISAENGLEPSIGNVSIKLGAAEISASVPAEDETIKTLSLGKALTPFTLEVSGQQQESLALIDKMMLDMGQGVLTVDATGNAVTNGNAANMEIAITSQLKPELLPEMGLSGSGGFSFPIHVNFVNGEQVTIDGAIKFEDYNVTFGDFKLENFNGSIKLNEELLLKDEFVGFKYVLEADPFQRVDFSRIQPYLDIENVLSFSKIQAGGFAVGPGMTSISIDQNLINLQRLDLEVFGGSVMGQMYFDAQPNKQKFGLLSRISRIDPREILPESSIEKQSKYAPLSMRTAVTFEVTERLMEGELDVTEINKAQLLQLLELVDPEHKDEQIATVRSALRFAHPEWVKVDMQSGLMNLEVSISAIPKPVSIRGLPLTPLIQQYAGDIEDALVQLPLREM